MPDMAQTDRLLIALAQLDPTVGDVDGNLGKARAARARAAQLGAVISKHPKCGVRNTTPRPSA
jgi:NAD+ synthase